MPLPDPIARLRPRTPDTSTHLAHIAEVSKNARTTWFGLLGILAFVGITLLAHEDAAFFTRAAATQLPLINIAVPVEAFFYTAPVLVAAIYAYLHLYLMSLWDALAEAPARIDGQPLSERVYPWLINHAALWYRDRHRGDGASAPRALGRTIVFVSFFLGWFFGAFVLLALWIRSMPAHDPVLTLWIAACLYVAALIGVTGFASAGKRMRGASREDTARRHGVRWHAALGAGVVLAVFSLKTTGQIPRLDDRPPDMMVPANLEEAELTPRPADWQPFARWLQDLRRARKIGDPEEDPLIPTEDEMGRWRDRIAALDYPLLKDRDLRHAQAQSAFLPGADLREARMQGADLSYAQMQGADLREAQMQGANLDEAQMQGADLGWAQMQGANLLGAQMQGADLIQARMQGADLRTAQMQGADLRWARMQGADLEWVEMQGANLERAEMQGANLILAQIQESDCTSAGFLAALVQSAALTCKNGTLQADQLLYTVGDQDTVLPEGLKVWSCLDRETLTPEILEQILEATARWGDRQFDFEAALFCAEGQIPERVGRHPDPDAGKAPASGN